jgi:hypothetical protein
VFIWLFWPGGALHIFILLQSDFRLLYKLVSRGRVRNIVHVVLYSTDKAVIIYILYSKLYKKHPF